MLYNAIGAGLQNGSVKTATGDVFDIYAIVEAGANVARDEVEVKGDDQSLGKFNFALKEELTIKANGLSFDVIQAITNNTLVSSPTYNEIALGTDNEKNPPFIEVSAETTAKDSGGTARTITKTWHKVQITSLKVNQAGETEFSLEMAGTAIQTATDIEGNALATKRIATVKLS
jgi:hypothetical protein